VFEPLSRRPHTSPTSIPAEGSRPDSEAARDDDRDRMDAGPDTIVWHLQHDHGVTVSRSSVARY